MKRCLIIFFVSVLILGWLGNRVAVADDLVVTEDGNVGIGTLHPGGKLQIDDAVTTITNESDYAIKINDGTSTTALVIGVNTANSAGIIQTLDPGTTWGSENLVFQPNGGNVGIGTTNPDPNYKLDVNGNIRAVGWASNSDARWKENIEPIGDSLELVTQLRGVTYEWIDKSKGTGQHVGVIAQEVEEVFPQVVHTDSQGYKSVEYSKLVAPLIEAVKALKDENENLRNENEMLKSGIEDIHARLEKLEEK